MANAHVAESYEGTDTYKHIDRIIRKGTGTLLIITPFIGPSYANMLWKQAGKKEVYLVISNSKINAKAWKLFTRGRRGAYVRPIAYFAALSAILFYFKIEAFAVLTIALTIVLLAIVIAKKGKRKNLHVKVSDKLFIHEKLYISDEEAITGSANLTFGGTHKNLEQISITKDPEEIKRLKEHFWSVWGKHH
ncbi:MAG: phospholipase D-like domain-containing protein [Candidatus Micrarchaeia archaeon]